MLHSMSIWKLYLWNWVIYENKGKCRQHGIREQPKKGPKNSVQKRKVTVVSNLQD